MVAVDAVISALVTLIVTPVPSDTVTLPTADAVSYTHLRAHET